MINGPSSVARSAKLSVQAVAAAEAPPKPSSSESAPYSSLSVGERSLVGFPLGDPFGNSHPIHGLPNASCDGHPFCMAINPIIPFLTFAAAHALKVSPRKPTLERGAWP